MNCENLKYWYAIREAMGLESDYPKVEPEPEVDYMWLQALEDGCEVGFYVNPDATVQPTIYYSLDKQTWQELTNEGEIERVSLAKDAKMYFRGENADGLMSPEDRSDDYFNYFSCVGKFDTGGNIMTLIDGDNPGETTRGVFSLFYNDNSDGVDIVNAYELELPATTLSASCYSDMFYNCSSLTSVPELPATTLAKRCYYQMFISCSSLTTAPELPATTLAEDCYVWMLANCSSLTTAPELPATTLVKGCYRGMFYGCSSLTTVPELPATTLEEDCYSEMFANCSSLTTAPELPATTLVKGCYSYMFSHCLSLVYIKCLATDISATSCTTQWVGAITSRGTFVKAAGMTSWITGVNGIPSSWTVEEE